MTSLDYNHAVKFRPKGYSVKVWEACVSEAIIDKNWALRTLKTSPQWVNQASEISIRVLGECLYKSVIELATGNYDYLKHRAFGQSYIGAVDPSARNRWAKLTGKQVPPSQYWLYDHRDSAKAKTLKFNVKQGWGWVKKTKSEIRSERIGA